MPAKKYGKWVTVNSLSEGGQAHTYLVKDSESSDDILCVLKRLRNTARIDRFKDEVRAGLDLCHANIIDIIDFDLEAEKPYLVTEHCSKGTLSQLNLSPLSLIQRLEVFYQICLGVGSAHTHKPAIIHRDLKPENIFIKEDNLTPVVGDFGICFIDDEGERFTMTDEVVGPRGFIAPELENGIAEIVTPAADVYSLGKLLYWMLSDKKLLPRENHCEGRFDLRKEANTSDIYIAYELLSQLLNANPKERLNDANEVTKELKLTLHRIRNNGHCVDINAPQECLYCRVGSYSPLSSLDIDRPSYNKVCTDFGLSSNHEWLVMVCSNCGNVQTFLPRYNKPCNIWTKK